jgi:hypothetical protein
LKKGAGGFPHDHSMNSHPRKDRLKTVPTDGHPCR